MSILKDILIVGYPRSGNTWLSRLLGDALNSPVTGLGSAHPIAEEGFDRPGKHIVRQLHLKPDESEIHTTFLPNAYTLAPQHYAGEKLIHVYRDPRDVTISAWKYWEIPSLELALLAVGTGLWPLRPHGAWRSYVSAWLDIEIPCAHVAYEELHSDPQGSIERICAGLNIDLDTDRLKQAIQRQAFDARKAEIEINGDRYMYGKAIQLKSMRHGAVGDWYASFTPDMAERAERLFGDAMLRLGYGEKTQL